MAKHGKSTNGERPTHMVFTKRQGVLRKKIWGTTYFTSMSTARHQTTWLWMSIIVRDGSMEFARPCRKDAAPKADSNFESTSNSAKVRSSKGGKRESLSKDIQRII